MLFLAGEGHGNCEKVRWTRRHPPMGRRGVTEYPKRNGGSENQSRRFKWACQIVCSTTAFFLLPSSGRWYLYLVAD